MKYVDVGSIKEGDRIRWRFPSLNNDNGGRVIRIIKWDHSSHYDAPYLDCYVDLGDGHGQQRAIGLPFVTHLNGRSVDRKYWNGRLPGLDLLRQPINEIVRSGGIQQIRFPLNEEDALALKTSTRKGLDEMSDSHRAHIEKWEPHIEKLGAEHVWGSANRFSGRGGGGPVYVAIKRGQKDYAIVDYDTEKQTKAKVLEDGFESSKTLMESFKAYRAKAKEERQASKPVKKAAEKKKPAAKKAPAAKAKKGPAKKPVRRKK